MSDKELLELATKADDGQITKADYVEQLAKIAYPIRTDISYPIRDLER